MTIQKHQPHLEESKHLWGLTATEVEASRQRYGLNLLTPPEPTPWWKLYLEKYEDPIIRILIVAALLAMTIGFVDGEYLEGLGILIAIFLATTVSFINEFKATQEFNILNQVNDEVPITVVRNSIFSKVPKKEIVVGDVVLLEAGDEVPADGLVIGAVSFQINESSLTGETLPVTKVTSKQLEKVTVSSTAYPPDQVMRGTIVVDGHGILEVIAIGDQTEIGRTARAAAGPTEEKTPLNQQLDRLSQLIGVCGLLIAVLIDSALIVRGILADEFNLSGQQWYVTSLVILSVTIALTKVWLPIVYQGLSLIKPQMKSPEWLEDEGLFAWLKSLAIGVLVLAGGLGIGWLFNWVPPTAQTWITAEAATSLLTYFMIAVAVIVVAVPEGLPLSVVLSLAYSMRRMTRQNALVRQMQACETIGATTVICSDKTGTLTLNKMQVSEACFGGDLDLMAEAIAINSTANLQRSCNLNLGQEEVIPIGDPTEGALLLWLDDQQHNYEQERESFRTLNQLTFSPERKYMATLGYSRHRASDAEPSRPIIHIKGAPEIVLAQCSHILTEKGVQPIPSHSAIAQTMQTYEAHGMRLLGFAYRDNLTLPYPEAEIEIERLMSQPMIWLGFVAIADPIRPDVPRAIKTCQRAQVGVKIVTGDNPNTSKYIARQIGLVTDEDGPECFLTGQDFAQLDDEQARRAVRDLKVLSRARPADKQRLVKLLQENGEVIAVTGDGTNDAPALNQAQVGLAMGQESTSVAKEASDIIILDHSFKSIENAVMWGRSLYQNIQKFILFQLTINVAACGIALLGPFININLPLTVTQLLWVNLIMDTFAALALATDPPNPMVMRHPPRNPKAFIITLSMAKQLLSVAFVFLIFFVAFLLYIQQDGMVDPYELSLFFTTFVMVNWWNLFNAKCFGLKDSVFKNLPDNPGFLIISAVILFGQIIIVQWGDGFFRTVPLHLQDWLVIWGGTSIILWVGELGRLLARIRSQMAQS
ncbi:calcium-translocating P-type ATPase, PMCA-type [Roseofilum reptotaenium CS-1145]|uniref:P-type Ca(2+) transporter n=1 Tax=Roseofilum reptotaenium AO1-A TaxID=1925591 RepID=A0A1L9QVL3_9CYAN|nr:calcium-translocating P-type ATPase, PMCA-type [Roseofilum reptotaenium]MDB9520238.1 calcium-translocating P-type ATPase, PMCA-type [Roseofilum reptotaenium CS-1145]OJJ26720.1 calcium-translocating P-type ATPase, PMCA-type [Roseofilum reptotaenium AO1-A]